MNKERLQEIIDIINSYPNTPYYPNICNELIQAVIKLQEDVNQLEKNRDDLKEYIQNLIYNIEPKGVRINFNCEYDSEEDYIRGMEKKSRLETLKEVLSKIQELEKGENNDTR